MKKLVVAVAAVIAVQIGVAVLVIWSGLYNVAASEKHLPWTRWILTAALRNSVETHSRSVEVPALTDPSLFHRGLGHYEGACSPCHGAPDEPRNAVALRMLPQPPYLADHVEEWNPAELFWIVKHGFKYTGMPAWPAQARDDEIWAMVAFLLRLPDLGADEYRSLARHGAANEPRVRETSEILASAGPVGEGLVGCARCHGLQGMGGGAGGFPRLAGQKPEYLLEAMRAYGSGARNSGIMQPVASELTDQEMKDISTYYASAEAPWPIVPEPEPDLLALGARIASDGIAEGDVPACSSCHGRDGSAAENAPLFPSLQGQWAEYLAVQLRLFRSGVRANSPTADIMAAAASGLTDEQIRAVSLYYASLRPGGVPVDANRRSGPEAPPAAASVAPVREAPSPPPALPPYLGEPMAGHAVGAPAGPEAAGR